MFYTCMYVPTSILIANMQGWKTLSIETGQEILPPASRLYNVSVGVLDPPLKLEISSVIKIYEVLFEFVLPDGFEKAVTQSSRLQYDTITSAKKHHIRKSQEAHFI